MGDHQQEAFVGSRSCGAGTQVWCQPTLGAAKHTFHVPTSSVFFRGKGALHLATVAAASRCVRASTMVNGYDRFANLPVFPATPVKLFRIVRGIAQQATNSGVLDCLSHHRQKAWSVVAWATTNHRRQDQMAAVIGHDGELEVTTKTTGPTRTRAAIDEVPTRVVRLQAGRIDADLTARRQQLQLMSPAEDFS